MNAVLRIKTTSSYKPVSAYPSLPIDTLYAQLVHYRRLSTPLCHSTQLHSALLCSSIVRHDSRRDKTFHFETQQVVRCALGLVVLSIKVR